MDNGGRAAVRRFHVTEELGQQGEFLSRCSYPCSAIASPCTQLSISSGYLRLRSNRHTRCAPCFTMSNANVANATGSTRPALPIRSIGTACRFISSFNALTRSSPAMSRTPLPRRRPPSAWWSRAGFAEIIPPRSAPANTDNPNVALCHPPDRHRFLSALSDLHQVQTSMESVAYE
jgi:hypothetical protein